MVQQRLWMAMSSGSVAMIHGVLALSLVALVTANGAVNVFVARAENGVAFELAHYFGTLVVHVLVLLLCSVQWSLRANDVQPHLFTALHTTTLLVLCAVVARDFLGVLYSVNTIDGGRIGVFLLTLAPVYVMLLQRFKDTDVLQSPFHMLGGAATLDALLLLHTLASFALSWSVSTQLEGGVSSDGDDVFTGAPLRAELRAQSPFGPLAPWVHGWHGETAGSGMGGGGGGVGVGVASSGVLLASAISVAVLTVMLAVYGRLPLPTVALEQRKGKAKASVEPQRVVVTGTGSDSVDAASTTANSGAAAESVFESGVPVRTGAMSWLYRAHCALALVSVFSGQLSAVYLTAAVYVGATTQPALSASTGAPAPRKKRQRIGGRGAVRGDTNRGLGGTDEVRLFTPLTAGQKRGDLSF